MSKGKEEKLINDSKMNTLLDKTLVNEKADKISSDISDQNQLAHDSKFTIQISEDKLSVYCSFYPAKGNGRILITDEITERLLDMGVSESVIDREKIDKCVLYVNKSGKSIEKNIIASGKAPVPHINEHIEIVFDPKDYITLINSILEEDKSQQIDYKKFSRLCILNEDTTVARVCKKQEGVQGITVTGEIIDFEIPRFKVIRRGANLSLRENGEIVTACLGEFQFRKNIISVNNVLELKNGINHETGNIQYAGTVVIHGEVQFDFSVHADENLIVHNTLSAADVYSGGNIIVVNGGIIGKEAQKVKAENAIKSVHIENAHVEAGSNIYIEKSAFSSSLRTNGLLHMGKVSKLLGCPVMARDGVVANDIGNDTGIKSTIICGEDIFIQEKINKIKEYRDELEISLNEKLKFDPMAETWELNNQIKKCDQGIEQIQSESECDYNVRVEVSGIAYPGTEVKIGNSAYQVTKELHHGFFYFNNKEAKVMFQNH